MRNASVRYCVKCCSVDKYMEEPAGEMVHPYHMPELYSPLGYIGAISVMALIVLVQVVYFRRKGLLGRIGKR